MKVKLSVSGDAELRAILDKMPKLVVASGGPIDNAVTKGGQVVARRARQLAPDSRSRRRKSKATGLTETDYRGSRQKQSKSARAIWSAKLKNVIRSVTRRYPATAVSVIGPKSPEGNMAHFMQEKGRRMVLWGKATMIGLYRIARNWITQAFDETKSAQHTAMLSSLRKDMDRVMRGGS